MRSCNCPSATYSLNFQAMEILNSPNHKPCSELRPRSGDVGVVQRLLEGPEPAEGSTVAWVWGLDSWSV